MTSLAKQLQQLAVVPQVQFVEDRTKSSLLFDPHEAAGINRETFYSLGLNGLMELCSLDNHFEDYEKHLFSEESIRFERTIHTKDVNRSLDTHIKQFLLRLSPHFLLQPAHKVIEWLIHRFRIHIFNTDELIACILPYHDTNIFVRALQLVNIANPSSKWNWLFSCQKAGVPIPRSTVINHCNSDPGFMNFLCELQSNAAELFADDNLRPRTIFCFSTLTIVGALRLQTLKKSDFVAQLMPHLLIGLRSANEQFVSSSYILMTSLMAQYKLKQKVCLRLVKVICKNLNEASMQNAISCLAHVYNTQRMSIFPTKDILRFTTLSADRLLEALSPLASNNSGTGFLKAFLTSLLSRIIELHNNNKEVEESSGLVDANSESLIELLTKLLIELKLPDELATGVLNELLTSVSSVLDDLLLSSAWFQRLVISLFTSYPTLSDQLIDKSQTELKDNPDGVSAADKLLHIVNSNSSTVEQALVVSLNHPLAAIRFSALKSLEESLKNGNIKDTFTFDSALIRDEDSLEYATLLLKLIEQYKLPFDMSQLFSVLKQSFLFDNRLDIAIAVASFLSNQDLEDSASFSRLLPYCFLLNSSPKRIELSRKILSSNIAPKDIFADWLQTSAKATMMPNPAPQLNIVLCKCLLTTDIQINPTFISLAGSAFSRFLKFDRFIFVVSLLFHFCWIDREKEKHNSIKASLMFLKEVLTDDNKLKFDGLDYEVISDKTPLDVAIECGVILESKKIKITSELVAALVSKMVNETPKTDMNLDMKSLKALLSSEEKTNGLQVELFLFLIARKNQFRPLLRIFIQRQCKTASDLICFLAKIVFNHSIPDGQRSASVAYSSTLAHLYSASLNLDSGIMIFLLLFLVESDNKVRQKALGLFKKLTQQLTSSDNEWGLFCVEIDKLASFASEDVSEVSLIKMCYLTNKQITSHRLLVIDLTLIIYFESLGDSKLITNVLNRSEITTSDSKIINALLTLVCNAKTPYYLVLQAVFCLSHFQSDEFVCTKLLPALEDVLSDLFKVEEGSKEESRLSSNLCLELYGFITRGLCAKMKLRSKPFVLIMKGLEHSQTRKLIVPHLTKLFWKKIDPSLQHRLFSTLLLATSTSTGDHQAIHVVKCLRKAGLSGEHFHTQFRNILDDGASSRSITRKRRIDDSIEKKQHLVPLIELTLSLKHLTGSHLIIDDLFTCLSRLLDSCSEISSKRSREDSEQHESSSSESEDDIQTATPQAICTNGQKTTEQTPHYDSSEYVIQLILRALVMTCEQAVTNKLLTQYSFAVERVIECLRRFSQGQTHHYAMQLLSLGATHFPESVLQHMMSVLTFMGSTLLRQDDKYSFQTACRSLQAVIGVVVKTWTEQKKDPAEYRRTMCDVLNLFSDTHVHIPSHRRLSLWTLLLNEVHISALILCRRITPESPGDSRMLVINIGPEMFLWQCIILLLRNSLTSRIAASGPDLTTADSLVTTGNESPIAEFLFQLCHRFDNRVLIITAKHLLLYLSLMPYRNASTCDQSTDSLALFHLNILNEKQYRHFCFLCTSFLQTLISPDSIQPHTVDTDSVAPLTEKLIEAALKYTAYILAGPTALEKECVEFSGKYWTVMLNQSHSILNKITALLSGSAFLGVVNKLLKRDSIAIQRRTLLLFNVRYSPSNVMSIQKEEAVVLLEISKTVVSIIVNEVDPATGSTDHLAILKQTALLSLKILAKRNAEDWPDTYVELLQRLFEHYTDHQPTNPQLQASFLLTFSAFVSLLRSHALSYLNNILCAILEPMKPEQRDVLIVSCASSLGKVMRSMGNFFTAKQLFQIIFQGIVCSNSSSGEVKKELEKMLEVVTRTTETRRFIPPVEECLSTTEASSDWFINHLVLITSHHVLSLARETVISSLKQLIDLIMRLLDVRFNSYRQIDTEQLDAIEAVVLKMLSFVFLKLSETNARPFFHKMLEKFAIQRVDSIQSLTTFFHIVVCLLSSLRSLFLSFMPPVLKIAAEILTPNEDSDADFNSGPTIHLHQFVLMTLTNCFKYDSDGSLDSEQLQLLLEPVISQIGREGITDYALFISEYVSPCIVEMASCTVEDSSIVQQLNYRVLLHSRNTSSKVRVSTLKIIGAVIDRLATNYSSLLPETVPFLSELLEDDDVEVESETKKVITSLEQIMDGSISEHI